MARIDIDALKAKFETGDIPTGADYSTLIDTLAAQSSELGTFGNNDQTINGIENQTIVDTFSDTEWRMVKYLVSISRASDNKFFATELTILCDGTNINVAEYGMIDNDGDIGTVSVSRAGGSVKLIVTPVSSVTPVTVRFARMGLKA